MDSNEVNLELESATAALRFWGEKYVGDTDKDSFHELVNQFYSHNTTIIEGYQSPVESFQNAVSNMHCGKYENSAINSQYAQGMKKESSDINASIYLGTVSYTDAEKKLHRENIAELFEKMRTGSADKNAGWREIEEAFLNYATKNSNDSVVRKYVADQTKYTFKRIKEYWSALGI